MIKKMALFILIVFGFTMLLSSASAQVTPDKALHPETNEYLWAWMNAYFDQLLADKEAHTSLRTLYQEDKTDFIDGLVSAMEEEGFAFLKDDKDKIMRLNYNSPKFPIMAICYTQIGSYIEWTIEDHYEFSQLMIKTGIYENSYGFIDALPSDDKTPSIMYQDALAHALKEFPQMKELLASLDVKIEYQRYSHPDFDSYELWSILWYDARTDSNYTLCAKYYTTENDYCPVGVWHIFDFE